MKIVVDGIMTEYEAAGNGKVVLFLHGWGSSSKVFEEMSGELKKKYRVVALNMPGFGGTDEPPSAWGVEDYVEFVTKFIEKLKLKKVYAVVGHSFGGRVMLKGFGEGKLEADKLVFMGSGGIKRKRSVKMRAYGAAAKAGRAVSKLPGVKSYAKLMRIKLYGAAGATDFVNASEGMREVFRNVVAEDLKRYIEKIEQPSLVIWGANDTDTPAKDAYEFKRIRDSRVHILNDAGHYVFLERPEECLKLVKEFLAK
ncbi:alpha/beta hydrolase [Candidatus Saccharibacteria bacterium]|nr:alpha/beta hydrolase [Candidatus Saccharibacteria bacterium]